MNAQLVPDSSRNIPPGFSSHSQITITRVTAVDTTAAGDTFVGYLAAGLASGASVREAVAAGGVEDLGASTLLAVHGLDDGLDAYQGLVVDGAWSTSGYPDMRPWRGPVGWLED